MDTREFSLSNAIWLKVLINVLCCVTLRAIDTAWTCSGVHSQTALARGALPGEVPP